MGFFHTLHLRLRCALRTRGLHELDVHSGRCRQCKQPWSTLYPGDKRNVDAGADSVPDAPPKESPEPQRGNSAFAARY